MLGALLPETPIHF